MNVVETTKIQPESGAPIWQQDVHCSHAQPSIPEEAHNKHCFRVPDIPTETQRAGLQGHRSVQPSGVSPG